MIFGFTLNTRYWLSAFLRGAGGTRKVQNFVVSEQIFIQRALFQEQTWGRGGGLKVKNSFQNSLKNQCFMSVSVEVLKIYGILKPRKF